MPMIQITTWPTWNEETKRSLLEEITRVTHEVTRAPLDKIIVVINEIQQSAWMEGGTLGSDPSFPQLSRRRSYEEGGAARSGGAES